MVNCLHCGIDLQSNNPKRKPRRNLPTPPGGRDANFQKRFGAVSTSRATFLTTLGCPVPTHQNITHQPTHPPNLTTLIYLQPAHPLTARLGSI